MKKLAYNEKMSVKTKKRQHRRRTVHGSIYNYMEPQSMNFDTLGANTPLITARHTRRPLQVVSASKTSNYLFSDSEQQTEDKTQLVRTRDRSIEPIVKSKNKLMFVSRQESSFTSSEDNMSNNGDNYLETDKKVLINSMVLTPVNCHANARKKSLEDTSGHSLVSLRKSGKLDFVVKDTKMSCHSVLIEDQHKVSSTKSKALNTSNNTSSNLMSYSNVINPKDANNSKAAGFSNIYSIDHVGMDIKEKMVDMSDKNVNIATLSGSTYDSIFDDEPSKSNFKNIPNVTTTEPYTDSSKIQKYQTATPNTNSKIKTYRKSSSMRKVLQEARIAALKDEENNLKADPKSSSNILDLSLEVIEQKSLSNNVKSPISLDHELENQSDIKTRRQETKDWMHLFEDPFPRRSPRLSSLPKKDLWGCEDLLDNSSPLTSRNNVKKSRSKSTSKSRSKVSPLTSTKKETDSQKMHTESNNILPPSMTVDEDIMTKTQEKSPVNSTAITKEHNQAKLCLKRQQKSSSCSGNKRLKDNGENKVQKEDGSNTYISQDDLSCMSEDIHFPRPSPELSRPGGPFTTVVDFCLPDKDFVKLKLAKIKGKQTKKVKNIDSQERTLRKNSSTVTQAKSTRDNDLNINKEGDGNTTCINPMETVECCKESTLLKTSEKQNQSPIVMGSTRNTDLSEVMMKNSGSESLSESILEPCGSRCFPSVSEQNKEFVSKCCVSSLCNDIDNTTDTTNKSIENSIQHQVYSKCHQIPSSADSISSKPINKEPSPCSSTTSSPSLLQGTMYQHNDCDTISKHNCNENKESQTKNSQSDSNTKVVPSSQGSQSQSSTQTFLNGLTCLLNKPKTDRAKKDLPTSPRVSALEQKNQRHDESNTVSNDENGENIPITGKDPVVTGIKNLKIDMVSGSESTKDSQDEYSTCDDVNGINTSSNGLANQVYRQSGVKEQSGVEEAANQGKELLTPVLNDSHPVPNMSSASAECVMDQTFCAVEQGIQASNQSIICNTKPDVAFKSATSENTCGSDVSKLSNTEIFPNQAILQVEESKNEERESINQDGIGSFPLCSNTEEFCIESVESVHLTVGNSPSIQNISDAKLHGNQITDSSTISSVLQIREGSSDDIMPPFFNSQATELSSNISVSNKSNNEDELGCEPMETENIIFTPCVKGSGNPGVECPGESQATEPSIGDTATPSGKANSPKCTSTAGFQCDKEEDAVLKPVLLQACLQHENSECSTVQSISMSSYNVPGLQSKKQEVIAICLTQWITVWVKNSGEDWTILKTWTLEFPDSEMFQKVEFLPSSSHIVIFAGGTFFSANGRIYGCSENMCYDFQLEYEHLLDTEVAFNSFCVLSHTDSCSNTREQDLELFTAGRSATGPLVSKWILDSLCLNAKSHSTLPLPNNSIVNLLSTVEGSHCLVIGLTATNLLLWNHKSCCLLKVIPIPTHLGLYDTDYLHVKTEMGLLFLIIVQRQMQKNDGSACYLYALNPRNNRFKCLSNLSSNLLSKSSVQCSTGSGQYIALGQENGSVSLWSMGTPQTIVNFPVFQGAVESASFHPTRPIVAFGGGLKACVHIYSLS